MVTNLSLLFLKLFIFFLVIFRFHLDDGAENKCVCNKKKVKRYNNSNNNSSQDFDFCHGVLYAVTKLHFFLFFSFNERQFISDNQLAYAFYRHLNEYNSSKFTLIISWIDSVLQFDMKIVMGKKGYKLRL